MARRTRHRFLAGGVLFVLLLLLLGLGALDGGGAAAAPTPAEISFSPQASSAHFRIDWSVVSAGGSTSSSAHFRVQGTIAQPTVSRSTSAHFQVQSGFWHLWGAFKLFLSAIFRP